MLEFFNPYSLCSPISEKVKALSHIDYPEGY